MKALEQYVANCIALAQHAGAKQDWRTAAEHLEAATKALKETRGDASFIDPEAKGDQA